MYRLKIILETGLVKGLVAIAVVFLLARNFVLPWASNHLGGKPDSSVAMFRGNLQRTGKYPSPAPREFNELVWQFETDSSVSSSPAISEGVVYFGSNDHHLYAVDVETGEQLWQFETDRSVSTPAISEGVVYFGSWDNYLRALQ
jgi:hypothetical protein